MKQRMTLLLTALIMCLAAVAQPKLKSPEEFKKEYQAFIIKRAQLTEKEAAAFFPIYDECEKKKQELNNKIWELRRETFGKELTEKDYQRILENIANLSVQIDELDRTYLPLYNKVLSYKKIFEVQGAESSFHREMLKGINRMSQQRINKERK